LDTLTQSEKEASLSECVQRWLERTPGLEEDGFNFPEKFRLAVEGILRKDLDMIEAESNDARRVHMMNDYKIKRDQFETVFDPRRHEALLARGERRFTHKALLGVIMIMLYREEPR